MDREGEKDIINNDDTTNQESSSAQEGKQHPQEKEETVDLIHRQEETKNIIVCTTGPSCATIDTTRTQSTSVRSRTSCFQDDDLIASTTATNNNNNTDLTVLDAQANKKDDSLALRNSSLLLQPTTSRIQIKPTTGRMMRVGRNNPDSALVINQSTSLPRESQEDSWRSILQQPRNVTDTANDLSSIISPAAGTITNHTFLHQHHLNTLSSEANRRLLLEDLIYRQKFSPSLVHNSSTSHTQQHLFDWTPTGRSSQQQLLNSTSMTTAGLSHHLLDTDHNRAYHSTVHPVFLRNSNVMSVPSTSFNPSDFSHQFQPNSSRNTGTNPNFSSWVCPVQEIQGTSNNSKEKDSTKRTLANAIPNTRRGEEERPCKKRKARDEIGDSSEIYSANQGANTIHPDMIRGIRAPVPTEVRAFNSPFLANAWTSGSSLLQNTTNTLPIQNYGIYGQNNPGRQEENMFSQTHSSNRAPILSALGREMQDTLLLGSIDGSIFQNNRAVNVPTAVHTEEAKQGLEQDQLPSSIAVSTFETDQVDQEKEKLILEEMALQMRTAEGSGRRFFPLGIEHQDSTRLSKFLCFVRLECIELFKATNEVVLERMSSKKVTADQVGIRCVFCAYLPARKRAGRSSNFPSSISRLYQGVSMMIYSHFGRCNEMPEGIRAKFEEIRKSTKNGDTESRSYWIESARLKGLVDCGEEQGIRMKLKI